MSNKYALDKSMLRNGVSYGCAYSRMCIGWPLERAVSEPPVKRAPRKTAQQRLDEYAAGRARASAVRAERQARAEWNIKARAESVSVVRKSPVTELPCSSIQRLRAAYCDHFIKFGELDMAMAAQLKDYADANRTVTPHPQRVPDEHEAQRDSRQNRSAGDDDNRDAA